AGQSFGETALRINSAEVIFIPLWLFENKSFILYSIFAEISLTLRSSVQICGVSIFASTPPGSIA
ncbi:hypothetical protein OFB72_32430, partial [Escherichia coli]|nr:hypothetical protein [Escherichia coli]